MMEAVSFSFIDRESMHMLKKHRCGNCRLPLLHFELSVCLARIKTLFAGDIVCPRPEELSQTKKSKGNF
jgi:hypothetical protein